MLRVHVAHILDYFISEVNNVRIISIWAFGMPAIVPETVRPISV